MSLGEGVQGIIVYNPYVSGNISANVEDNAPPTSGGKTLRRVSSTLNLEKNTYQSNEVRADRQIVDYRHGTRRVQGDVVGELSPTSFFDMFEAIHRDTRIGPVTIGPSVFTSFAASSAGTFTAAAGDPVAAGLFVGDVIRFSGFTTAAANNGVNFLITGFSGTSNRIIGVTPNPITQAADNDFSLSRPGYSTFIPSSGFVKRKWGIEILHTDLSLSRLFTEVRWSKYMLDLPATGLARATISAMGRDMTILTGSQTPYFTAAAAPNTEGITQAVNGKLLLAGVQIGVVTGATIECDLTPTNADVVGQNFAAETFLGRADVKGQLTAFLEDDTLFNDFLEETELQLLLSLSTTDAVNAPTLTYFLPRIKLGGANLALQGEGGQIITSPYQALKYIGASPGVPVSTIRMLDTEVS